MDIKKLVKQAAVTDEEKKAYLDSWLKWFNEQKASNTDAGKYLNSPGFDIDKKEYIDFIRRLVKWTIETKMGGAADIAERDSYIITGKLREYIKEEAVKKQQSGVDQSKKNFSKTIEALDDIQESWVDLANEKNTTNRASANVVSKAKEIKALITSGKEYKTEDLGQLFLSMAKGVSASAQYYALQSLKQDAHGVIDSLEKGFTPSDDFMSKLANKLIFGDDDQKELDEIRSGREKSQKAAPSGELTNNSKKSTPAGDVKIGPIEVNKNNSSANVDSSNKEGNFISPPIMVEEMSQIPKGAVYFGEKLLQGDPFKLYKLIVQNGDYYVYMINSHQTYSQPTNQKPESPSQPYSVDTAEVMTQPHAKWIPLQKGVWGKDNKQWDLYWDRDSSAQKVFKVRASNNLNNQVTKKANMSSTKNAELNSYFMKLAHAIKSITKKAEGELTPQLLQQQVDLLIQTLDRVTNAASPVVQKVAKFRPQVEKFINNKVWNKELAEITSAIALALGTQAIISDPPKYGEINKAIQNIEVATNK